ncbi:MAG: DUF1858 domain-containing protein [Chloroflexaceae bacterium]|nr:DUF1858 domain-containing protein [Chloroflexaceae bacterium]
MYHTPLHPELTVDEVLQHWPGVVSVFMRRRMACVGCVMARFETLRDVAASYHMSLECLLEELNQEAQAPPEPL